MKYPTTQFAAIILAITSACSTSTSIYWGEDSPTAFNLTIAGAGIDYFKTFTSPLGPQGTQNIYSETFTSPSGLWELGAGIKVDDYYGPGIGDLVIINRNATATFLGLPEHPSMLAEGYGGSIYWSTKSVYNQSDFATEGGIYDEWDGRGGLTFLVTSAPDYRDPSTWVWVMNITARGPSLLSNRVPESGGISVMIIAAIALATTSVATRNRIA